MLLTGAEIASEVLIEQGVTDIFGYPGGAALNLYDALYDRQDRIHHHIIRDGLRIPLVLLRTHVSRVVDARILCVLLCH